MPVQEAEFPAEQHEQYSTEGFLRKLYSVIEEELKTGENTQVLVEYEPETVQRWETQGIWPTGTMTFGIDMEKAVLISDEEHVYALVLGKRLRSRYDRGGRTLGLQFGFRPKPEGATRPVFGSESAIEDLESLVNQVFTHGSGEFFIREFNRISINLWADSSYFGGDEIGSWPPAQLQSDRGIEACLSVVRRTIDRSFQ